MARDKPLVAMTVEPMPRHRHVALAIRAYIERENITASEFGRRIGINSTSNLYPWMKGSGAIGASMRPTVARLLGVPVRALAPWDGVGDPPDLLPLPDPSEKALGPVRAARAVASVLAPSAVLPPPTGGKLAYEGHGDGTATVMVRARLKLAQAKPLFRLLLDSGIDLEDGDDGDNVG